jgi:hypothetical protein
MKNIQTTCLPLSLESALTVEVLGTKVGLAVGLANIAAVAGATDAENPASTSAACTVFTALVSFVATVAAFKFVVVTRVVIITPANRIRRPIVIICIYYKPTFSS